jgi:hypothetical protein
VNPKNYSKMKMRTIDHPKTLITPVISAVRRHKQEIVEAHDFGVIALERALQKRETGDSRFKTPGGEQGGTGQPATRPESKSEGSDKPQPEAEGRSR